MPGRIEGKCLVCDETDAKYRCPKCKIVYCSLVCFKPHKESCANTVQQPMTKLDDRNTQPSNEATINTPFVGDGGERMSNNLTSPESSVPQHLLLTEENDRVPEELLRKLGDSNHLKGLLNNKHLRDMLHEINTSQNQSKTMEKVMQIPIFTEFVDECLNVIEPDKEQPQQILDLSLTSS